MLPQVFISYRRADSTILAHYVAEHLEKNHITAFVDVRQVDGGGLFPDRLRQAIEDAPILVCLLGSTTLDSEWVRQEIEHAHQHDKILIPVFQESYRSPTSSLDEHIAALLESDGIHIFDKRGLYVDNAIHDLIHMIQATLRNLQRPVPHPENDRDNADVQLASIAIQNDGWKPIIKEIVVHDISFQMCFVPSGSFLMGGVSANEVPHLQTISQPFWIGLYPVTNAQWRSVVEASGGEIEVPLLSDWYNDIQREYHPVVGVTWYQCLDFIRWLGEFWYLPSELEWEYVARGPDARAYPWGNDFQPNLLIYDVNSLRSTARVFDRPDGASWVGAQDMSGNVWEWTRSKYVPYSYSPASDYETFELPETSLVLRGGAWDSSTCHAAHRIGYVPSEAYQSIGFRICVSANHPLMSH